jgi:hypothetical protein
VLPSNYQTPTVLAAHTLQKKYDITHLIFELTFIHAIAMNAGIRGVESERDRAHFSMISVGLNHMKVDGSNISVLIRW